MRKALRECVNILEQLLENYKQNPDNKLFLSQYVQTCVTLSRNMPPSYRNEIDKEVLKATQNSPIPDTDIWDDSELYSLFLAKKAFNLAGITLKENIFLNLHKKTLQHLPENETSPLLVTIPSHILYEKLAMAVATGKKGAFDGIPQDKWPTHRVDETSVTADFLLRPPIRTPISLLENSPQYNGFLQLMNDRLVHMDELTMDVMHIICARWLEANPISPLEFLKLTADDILEARGLQKHLNAEGRRGGYSREQRDSIQIRMAALSSLWISVNNMKITVLENGKRVRKSTRYESPALIITGRFGEIGEDGDVDLWTWNVRPGDVFSTFLLDPISRETALFPKKSLGYDPIRQGWEKRLSFYLSWQWRVQRSKGSYKPYKVKTLLKAIHEVVDKQHPLRTRERLETALNTLQKDKLIHNWQYEIKHPNLPTQGWDETWQNWKLSIKPIRQLTERQTEPEQISFFEENNPNQPDAPNEINNYAQHLKELRKKYNLSQTKAAEELGIARTLINQVESGKRKASQNMIEKIQQWQETRVKF